MPSHIKYICLSDTHFGDPSSLLTALGADDAPNPLEPSQVLDRLVSCLDTLIPEGTELPTLVLNGDILELALTTTNEALMTFMQFIRLVAPPPESERRRLVGRIVYLMGNHDHHIWETAREAQYRNHLLSKKDTLFGNLVERLPPAYHATNMFEGGRTVSPPSELVDTAIRLWPWLDDGSLPVTVFYPNFGVFDPALERCVVFHHGHFLEPLYHLMSVGRRLALRDEDWHLRDAMVWDMETENFAWIDFLWSTLGRSGAAGEVVDLIYQVLPDAGARARLIDNLARELPEHVDIPYVPGAWLERWLSNKLFHKVADRLAHSGRNQTQDVQAMVREYVRGPLVHQMRGELESRALLDEGRPLPFQDLTFAHGHTHVPGWDDSMDAPEEVALRRVFNTGGWVVDGPSSGRGHGGALVVVDQTLDTAGIRLFRDRGCDDDYRIKVQGQGQLAEYLQSHVDRDYGAWSGLVKCIESDVKRRRALIKHNIDEFRQGRYQVASA